MLNVVDFHDVITCATFCDDRLRGSGVARGRISRFPIDLRRRPYNTLALPCDCECVMVTTYTPALVDMEQQLRNDALYRVSAHTFTTNCTYGQLTITTTTNQSIDQ